MAEVNRKTQPALDYDTVYNALTESLGNLTVASKMLEVDRLRLVAYIKKYKKLESLLDEGHIKVRELFEYQLANRVITGDIAGMKLYLQYLVQSGKLKNEQLSEESTGDVGIIIDGVLYLSNK